MTNDQVAIVGLTVAVWAILGLISWKTVACIGGHWWRNVFAYGREPYGPYPLMLRQCIRCDKVEVTRFPQP